MGNVYEQTRLKEILLNDPETKTSLSKINQERYLHQIKILISFLPKNSKVLDLGCGNGHISAVIKELRPDVDLFAVNYPKGRPLWKKINKYYDIHFNVGDGANLSFSKNTFDAVLSFGVMEHINEYYGVKKKNGEDKYLNEIKRVLKKKGLFFICNLPNKYSLNENICKLAGFAYHDRRYSKKEIFKILSNKNFEIIKFEREPFLPSHFEIISLKLNKVLNKFPKILSVLDKIIMYTPLRFFCESFLVVGKKKN